MGIIDSLKSLMKGMDDGGIMSIDTDNFKWLGVSYNNHSDFNIIAARVDSKSFYEYSIDLIEVEV